MSGTDIDIDRELAIASLYDKRGNPDMARKCYQAILAIDPANESAEQGMERLALRYPTSDQLAPNKQSYDKLIAYVRSDKRDEALEESERLCAQYPSDPKLAYARGLIQLKWEMFTQAVASFRYVLGLDPEFFAAHYELAKIFQEKKQLRAAGLCFENALKSNPNHVEAINLLGLTQKDLGNLPEAEASFLRALEISPDDSGVLNNLGILYTNMGKNEEARELYEKALEIAPEQPNVHKNLSLIKKYTPGDPQLIAMENILSQPDLSDDKKVIYSFSVAKAYEDIGDQKRCVELLEEGGRIRTKQLNYKIGVDEELIQRIKGNWDGGLIPDSSELEYDPISIRPIFVLGMPRSGTTLSEQILASHSQVHGAGELWEFGRLLKIELANARWHLKADNAEMLTQKSIMAVRHAYIKFLEEMGTTEKIIVDKMPLNFRWAGFIQRIFPEAIIVHQVRSPMATCWSCYKFHFTDGNGFSFDQENLARFYNLYLEIMSFWREQGFPNFYDLNYEALTQNQEEETRKLLDFCDLEWEEQCLSFHKTDRKVATASSQQVRQKMYTGSSEAWKKFEPYLQPLINGLNERNALGKIIT